MVPNSDTVQVFSFRVFDPQAAPDDGCMRVYPMKAPRDTVVSRFAGEVLEGTGQQVPSEELDEQGCWHRVASGWAPLA